MACLQVSRSRTHEVREFKRNGFVVAGTFCCFQFHTQLVELNGQEADRHVTVERFCIGPALHAVFVRQFFVDTEERIQLIVVNMTVLKGASFYYIMNAV